MLAKRIIPCLDVKDGKVVKGVRFKGHEIVGDIVELAKRYRDEGADELVFYDITASTQQRVADIAWIAKISDELDVPFCVAGGIRTPDHARAILYSGADKISVNSPALEQPSLIDSLAHEFGTQCVVVGIDSYETDGYYRVYQYTGDPAKSRSSGRSTFEWAQEAVARGAGEIVLNCMNQDGVRRGYDLPQLEVLRQRVTVPLVASGGAGCVENFYEVFVKAKADAALAAGIFHGNLVSIGDIKSHLQQNGVCVRP